MNKFNSTDSLNTINSHDIAYFSDTNNESNPIILELLAMVKKLSLDMAELKEKVCHQETIPSAFPPTSTLTDNESQTNDLNTQTDNLPNEDQEYKIPTQQIKCDPQLEICHDTTSPLIQSINFDDYVENLQANMVRMSGGGGREYVVRYLNKIEQITHKECDRKWLLLRKCDSIILNMIGGLNHIQTLQWPEIKSEIINISTQRGKIESLEHLYQINWQGEEDPLVFAASLQEVYDATPEFPLPFEYFLNRAITNGMNSDMKSIWSDMFDDDPIGTLSQIASKYQERGQAFFFDIPPIQKPVNRSQINVVPQIIYGITPYLIASY